MAGQYTGIGAFRHRTTLRQLIRETDSKTVLDFGCGLGIHLVMRDHEKLFAKTGVYAETWAEALGVERVDGYDPANKEYATFPTQTYDCVYSVDVAEHLSEEDVPWIITELFSLTIKCLFVTIALVPAKKNLPNGENAHITMKPREWWLGHFEHAAAKFPQVRWQAVFEEGAKK